MYPLKSHRTYACERCNEIALFTLELTSPDVDVTVTETGDLVVQPAMCPKCSGKLFEASPLTLQPTTTVVVDLFTLRQAQHRIVRCEYCTDEAELTFDYILDAVTGHDPTSTEYVLNNPAKCPNCLHSITEKTLVVPDYG